MERRAFIKAPLAATGELLTTDLQLDRTSADAQSLSQSVFVEAEADRDAAPFKARLGDVPDRPRRDIRDYAHGSSPPKTRRIRMPRLYWICFSPIAPHPRE